MHTDLISLKELIVLFQIDYQREYYVNTVIVIYKFMYFLLKLNQTYVNMNN